jgi:hypothetical protein
MKQYGQKTQRKRLSCVSNFGDYLYKFPFEKDEVHFKNLTSEAAERYTYIHTHTFTYGRPSDVRLPWIRSHSTEIQGRCRIRAVDSSVAEHWSMWGCDAVWLRRYLPTFRRHEGDGIAIFRNVVTSQNACFRLPIERPWTVTESRGTARLAAQRRLCHFCMNKSSPTWLGILSASHVAFSFSGLGWKTKRGRNVCGLQNAQCFNYELLLTYEPVERGVLQINKWGRQCVSTYWCFGCEFCAAPTWEARHFRIFHPNVKTYVIYVKRKF